MRDDDDEMWRSTTLRCAGSIPDLSWPGPSRDTYATEKMEGRSESRESVDGTGRMGTG